MAVKTTLRTLAFFCALLTLSALSAQKVGVVLSGGGASGMVHIGVLKALEENNIPIDYITGTSIGALVGALYCAGYSPEEMDSLFQTDNFRIMAQGGVEPQYEHFFQKPDADASLISLKFFTDTTITTSIPTNLKDPALLDLELMFGFAGASAISDQNMDSLFIPFRCVASDVESKKAVIFKDGDLAQAVRASMSYPFYFKSIKVNGHIMFDGGLYNNFPSDVMLEDFDPDILIGSNVSYNDPPPDEDDIISLLKAIMIEKTDYSVPRENGILIEPATKVGRFDFNRSEEAVSDGYTSTMAMMDSIENIIGRRVERKDIIQKRAEFNNKKPTLNFSKVNVSGLNKSQTFYTKKILSPKKGREMGRLEFKKKYFRAHADKNIKDLYPIAKFDPLTKTYDLEINAKREKDLEVQFGGVFSSKPINTGFIGLKYRLFEKASSIVAVNSYFGKFYGSVHGKVRIDLSTKTPIYIEPQITMNRWDYFKNFATFFEDARPSFIVLHELHAGINNGYSLGSKGALKLDMKYAQLRDEYYQTDEFSNTDTADVTNFNNGNVGLRLERNSLNRKEYANQGELIGISVRYVSGHEDTTPGSTSEIEPSISSHHEWFQFKFELDKYFNRKSVFKYGVHLSSVISDQPFFDNYTASIIRAPVFTPIPESRTRVMDEFRAHKFVAGGIRTILTIKKSIDVRLEGFIFQSFEAIERNEEDKAVYGTPFASQYYIGSGSLVWSSPVGPLAFSVNYFDEQAEPWSVIFSFGYILFNQKAIE